MLLRALRVPKEATQFVGSVNLGDVPCRDANN